MCRSLSVYISPLSFVPILYQLALELYQELLQDKSKPQRKGNRKGIIVKGKEFYRPILNTFPTRYLEPPKGVTLYKRGMKNEKLCR